VLGPAILVRAMSEAVAGAKGGKPFAYGRSWQYHPRSDRHSKIACWCVLFDLLRECSLLRSHVDQGKVGFGINHEMRDFARNRKKNLDLVLCRLAFIATEQLAFADLPELYGFKLTEAEAATLRILPRLLLTAPTAVLLAVEAKACMTEHGKARPRLYDELNSSHLMIHGDTDEAIAAGLAMVNAAKTFISPLRNPWEAGSLAEAVTTHRQPDATIAVVEKLKELPRRTRPGDVGYDAFGIVIVDCRNDGGAVALVDTPSASPGSTEIFDYEQFIRRLAQIYATRFGAL
jgi:hypothetical protein